MKSKKKVILTLACAVLLVFASVMGTMAYLTSQDKVVNTFSVGNVAITLDEAPVDENGDATTGDRVKANSYKLMPGHDYDKDPTVHVDAASEACWVFVQVIDEIADIQAADTVATQMAQNGWTLVQGETNVYAKADPSKAGEDLVVFETFKIIDGVANTELASYDGKTISVKAYAVQADGFDTALEAWEDAPTDWDF